MVLLRRVIGDALRARRQGQHRTLREVSTAANVSLGYLSEIERGQKEPSSELLAAVCEALGAQLSELLREVSDTLMVAEQVDGVLAPVQVGETGEGEGADDGAGRHTAPIRVPRPSGPAGEGEVSVTVRHDTPLRTTLRATRGVRRGGGAERDRDRDVVYAA